MDVHLTFDANVSARVTLTMEEVSKLTGLRGDMLEKMESYDVEDLLEKLPFAELLALGVAEFKRAHGLVVSTADMELAVMEVY